MPSLFSRSRTTSTPDAVDSGNADEFGRVKKKKSSKLKQSTLPEPATPITAVPEQLQQHLQDGAFLPANLSVGKYENECGYLSYKRDVILSLEQVARLTEVLSEELGSRGGITTPFIFSSLALDVNMGGIRRLIDKYIDACRAGFHGEAEHRWREEARFSGPHELAMVLRWGLGRVVRVVSGLQIRGLINWEHYQEFRDTEAALNYPPTHFTSFLPVLSPPLRSIILTTLSLLTRLTAHSATSGHTPPTLSPLFGPLFFGLGPQVGAFHHTYAYYLRATHATEHLLLAFIRWQDSPRPRGSEESYRLGPGAAAALAVPTRLKEWIKDYPATLPFLSSVNSDPHERPQPRKGARIVRLLSVRRNTRMYTKDLVKSASSWAYRKPPSSSGGIEPNGLIGTKEWDRISPVNPNASGTLPPRYTDSYRKRMNLPSAYQPDSSYQPTPTVYGHGSVTSSSPPTTKGLLELDIFGGSTLSLVSSRNSSETSATAQFRSLTDLKWGEFESLGFSSPSLLSPSLSSSSSILSNSTNTASTVNTSPAGSLLSGTNNEDLEKKLQFDLTETARSYSRSSKRQTLSWNDFSSAGFSRSDNPLNTSLSFSPHLTLSLNSEKEKEEKEKEKKLLMKKPAPSKMPAFGWDTTPILGGEEVVEESFVDVWCDLVWGTWGGLQNSTSTTTALPPSSTLLGPEEEKVLQRDLDRDCNWALIEFKSLPPNMKSLPPRSTSVDPRTGATILLFEEFVPFEYRQELAKVYGLVPSGGLLGSSNPRLRLPSLFTPGKEKSKSKSSSGDKGWKQAPTLNGRPYVVGHVPSSPSTRELEFEGLLRGGGKKVISLEGRDRERERERPAVKQQEQPQAQAQQPSAQPAFSPTAENMISGPLFVEPRAKAQVQPPPIVTSPPSSSTKQDSNLQRVQFDMNNNSTPSPTSTPSKKPRFRIANKVGKGDKLAPAEYTSVDFETRYAGESSSSSDSESNHPTTTPSARRAERQKLQISEREREEKRKRRESRRNGEDEDAWVDILIGNQSRGRLEGQDVEMTSGSTRVRRKVIAGGKSDPDLASMQVAQALAGVRRRSSSEDEQDVKNRRSGGVYERDADVDEIETVPRQHRQQVQSRDSEDSEIMEPVSMSLDERYSKADSTLDYYARGGAETEEDEDDEDDYGEDDESTVAAKALRDARERRAQASNYFNLHPDRRPVSTLTAGSRYSDDEDQSVDESGLVYDEEEPETKPAAKPQPQPQPQNVSPPPGIRPLPTVPVPAKSSIPVLVKNNTNSSGATEKSKTASLIEMYREKEKTGSGSPSNLPPLGPIAPLVPTPAPSRLPVRKDPQSTPTQTPPEDLEPPKPPAQESGRASPARYVHGAPLHNVLEEEEED